MDSDDPNRYDSHYLHGRRKSYRDYFYPDSRAARWKSRFIRIYLSTAVIVFALSFLIEFRS